MNEEINIDIFRLIQEKSNLFESIVFIIDDSSLNGIKKKKIIINFMNSKDVIYEIVLQNIEIKDLVKNIYKKNISTIEIQFSSRAIGLYQIDIFPKFIKKLNLQFNFNCEILKYLPEDLEHLIIFNNLNEIKTELNNLPTKLKELVLIKISYNLSLDYLPLSLEKLVLLLNNEYNHSFDNLPSNLNYLEICFYVFIDEKILSLNNLPEKIQHIKLRKPNGFIINKYPSNLKLLELCSKNKITNVPKNIEFRYYKMI